MDLYQCLSGINGGQLTSLLNGGHNMYTKTEILQIAKKQLALDYNCQVSDFEKEKNTIVENKLIDGRRIYDHDGCFLKLLCFGDKAIIKTSPMMMPWCEEKLLNRDVWIFEYPKLRAIDKKLNEFGHEIADNHHYYLPNPDMPCIDPITNVKWYEAEEILQFENDDRFGEAFAFDENHPDVLAVAAFDGDNIMGMAGASEDSKTMWQVGIDVLPEYRGRGIGTKLTILLKDEILKRGKVPFYGTGESHFHSQNIAINAGFFPAWAELYSESKE
jgi:GNAT superfamily N-acetyltransferase